LAASDPAIDVAHDPGLGTEADAIASDRVHVRHGHPKRRLVAAVEPPVLERRAAAREEVAVTVEREHDGNHRRGWRCAGVADEAGHRQAAHRLVVPHRQQLE
jgi:hypothetical protein